MAPRLDDVCWASLPSASLAVLADLRCLPDVRVALIGDRAWVRWPAGEEAVLRRVLPVAGAELFAERNGLWYRPGHALPTFGLPLDAPTQPLDRALTPAPFQAEPPPPPQLQPARLRLVRDGQPRAATALLAYLEIVRGWADLATTAQLTPLRAARAGEQVLLVGQPLPPLPGAERFWGVGLLVPLGCRPEPALPERALRAALGVQAEQILLLREGGAEVIPQAALQPLTRARVRLAAGEGR
jgi:hypothetical protein